MWITDHPLYGPGPIDPSWVDVGDPIPQGDGTVVFQNADGYLSARADGTLIRVPTIGSNETFTISGNFAKVTIGEGNRVYGVA